MQGDVYNFIPTSELREMRAYWVPAKNMRGRHERQILLKASDKLKACVCMVDDSRENLLIYL